MTAVGQRRRRLAVAAAALLVLAGCTQSDDAGRGAAPDRPPAQAEQPPAGGAAYTPQPERRFVRVGATGGRQFTDDELRFLVDNFQVVLFTKFHGGFDMSAQHDAARRLVAMDPDIQVFPYFSTKYWFDQNQWGDAQIDPAYFLRDNEGNLVNRDRRRDRETPEDVTYVDLANPAYRGWALQVLGSWLKAAPYAGISFDAAEPIGDYGERDVTRWERLLGPERVEAYNAGLRELLAGTDALVGLDRQVVFNGIAPSPARGPERNLDLLEVTDGALDERFCLDARGDVRGIDADLSLLAGPPPGKRLFLRTNYLDDFDPAQRERYQRFCLGAFLLGWEPGQSYFQFGGDYTAEQLQNDPADLTVNLGRPQGEHQSEEDLRRRQFENGLLYVNLGDEEATATLDDPLTEVRGGRVVTSYRPGDPITVAPGDAAFLLRPALVEAQPGG